MRSISLAAIILLAGCTAEQLADAAHPERAMMRQEIELRQSMANLEARTAAYIKEREEQDIGAARAKARADRDAGRLDEEFGPLSLDELADRRQDALDTIDELKGELQSTNSESARANRRYRIKEQYVIVERIDNTIALKRAQSAPASQ